MKSLAFLLIIASPYFEKLHSVRRAVESFVLVKKFVHGHHPEEFGVSLSLDPFSLTEQGLLFKVKDCRSFSSSTPLISATSLGDA